MTPNLQAPAQPALAPLVRLHQGRPVTDSLAIAREFKRLHKNVLATLDSLIADESISRLDFKPSTYRDGRGKMQRMIELTERGALIAMPFIGGKNSRIGQVRLVDAFMLLRQQAIEKCAGTWKGIRQQAAASYRFMSQSLEMTRADDGKITQTYHYATEAKLLNWVLTGRFTPLNRDDLGAPDLALLEALEARNAVLIARGLPYAERKAALPVFSQAWRDKRAARFVSNEEGYLLAGVAG